MIELAEDIENNKSLRVKFFKVCITIVYSMYERYYSPDRKKPHLLLDVGLTLANNKDIISRRYIR